MFKKKNNYINILKKHLCVINYSLNILEKKKNYKSFLKKIND